MNDNKQREVNMKEKFTGMLAGMRREATAVSILTVFNSVVGSCHYDKGVQQ